MEPPSRNVDYETVVTSSARVDFAAGTHGTGEDNNVNAKILAKLECLQDCLGRLEVSQIKEDGEERIQGDNEADFFGIVLGRSFDASRMRVDELYHTPPRHGQI